MEDPIQTTGDETDTCAGCGRTLHPERETCLYCGGSAQAAPSHGGSILEEVRAYEGATWPRFVFSSLVLIPLGLALLWDALNSSTGSLAFALPCFVFGPLVLCVQLLRRSRGWLRATVTTLRMQDGQELPWSQFTYAERVEGLGSTVTHPAAPNDPRGVQWLRRIGVSAGPVGFFLVPVYFVLWIVLPAVGLLTPWHRRIVLHRKRGDRLVLHDPSEAQSLLAIARAGIDHCGNARSRRRIGPTA